MPDTIKNNVIFPIVVGAVLLLMSMIAIGIKELNSNIITMNLSFSTKFVTVEEAIKQINRYQSVNYKTLTTHTECMSDHETRITDIERYIHP